MKKSSYYRTIDQTTSTLRQNKLPHERAHALKLIRENQEDPNQPSITDASTLNKLSEGQHNPFRSQWEPKPYRSSRMHKVPKNFYNNYRKTMITEAEEAASDLIS